MIKLKPTNLFVQLACFGNKDEPRPSNLCELTWGSIAGFVMASFVVGFLYFVLYTMVLTPIVVTIIFLQYEVLIVDIELIVGMTIWAMLLVVVVIAAFEHFDLWPRTRRSVKDYLNARTVIKVYRGWKERYCTLVGYVGDDE